MQQRRPNPERAEATRAALLAAARMLFVEKGYADTSTPEIVAAAKVTRGALYHHYADKADLFRAVIEREAKAVADEIEASASPDAPPGEALIQGSLAYLQAMSVPGRTRLLLVDGPAVLGPGALAALDEAHAARTLREGLEAALSPPQQEGAFIEALTALLSAAFDRAALAIEAGGDRAAYTAAMIGLVERVTASR